MFSSGVCDDQRFPLVPRGFTDRSQTKPEVCVCVWGGGGGGVICIISVVYA